MRIRKIKQITALITAGVFLLYGAYGYGLPYGGDMLASKNLFKNILTNVNVIYTGLNYNAKLVGMDIRDTRGLLQNMAVVRRLARKLYKGEKGRGNKNRYFKTLIFNDRAEGTAYYTFTPDGYFYRFTSKEKTEDTFYPLIKGFIVQEPDKTAIKIDDEIYYQETIQTPPEIAELVNTCLGELYPDGGGIGKLASLRKPPALNLVKDRPSVHDNGGEGIGYATTSGQGMGPRMVLQQTVELRLSQELRLKLLPLMRSLKAGIDEAITTLYNIAEQKGAFREFDVHGMRFRCLVFKKSDYADAGSEEIRDKADFIESVLADTVGFCLHSDLKGEFFRVVDGDTIPEEFIPYIAAHEYGESVFGRHLFATMLEFASAKKDGRMKKLINWWLTNFAAKFSLANIDFFHHETVEELTVFDRDVVEAGADDVSAQRAIELVEEEGGRLPKRAEQTITAVDRINKRAKKIIEDAFGKAAKIVFRKKMTKTEYLSKINDAAQNGIAELQKLNKVYLVPALIRHIWMIERGKAVDAISKKMRDRKETLIDTELPAFAKNIMPIVYPERFKENYKPVEDYVTPEIKRRVIRHLETGKAPGDFQWVFETDESGEIALELSDGRNVILETGPGAGLVTITAKPETYFDCVYVTDKEVDGESVTRAMIVVNDNGVMKFRAVNHAFRTAIYSFYSDLTMPKVGTIPFNNYFTTTANENGDVEFVWTDKGGKEQRVTLPTGIKTSGPVNVRAYYQELSKFELALELSGFVYETEREVDGKKIITQSRLVKNDGDAVAHFEPSPWFKSEEEAHRLVKEHLTSDNPCSSSAAEPIMWRQIPDGDGNITIGVDTDTAITLRAAKQRKTQSPIKVIRFYNARVGWIYATIGDRRYSDVNDDSETGIIMCSILAKEAGKWTLQNIDSQLLALIAHLRSAEEPDEDNKWGCFYFALLDSIGDIDYDGRFLRNMPKIIKIPVTNENGDFYYAEMDISGLGTIGEMGMDIKIRRYFDTTGKYWIFEAKNADIPKRRIEYKVERTGAHPKFEILNVYKEPPEGKRDKGIVAFTQGNTDFNQHLREIWNHCTTSGKEPIWVKDIDANPPFPAMEWEVEEPEKGFEHEFKIGVLGTDANDLPLTADKKINISVEWTPYIGTIHRPVYTAKRSITNPDGTQMTVITKYVVSYIPTAGHAYFYPLEEEYYGNLPIRQAIIMHLMDSNDPNITETKGRIKTNLFGNIKFKFRKDGNYYDKILLVIGLEVKNEEVMVSRFKQGNKWIYKVETEKLKEPKYFEFVEIKNRRKDTFIHGRFKELSDFTPEDKARGSHLVMEKGKGEEDIKANINIQNGKLTTESGQIEETPFTNIQYAINRLEHIYGAGILTRVKQIHIIQNPKGEALYPEGRSQAASFKDGVLGIDERLLMFNKWIIFEELEHELVESIGEIVPGSNIILSDVTATLRNARRFLKPNEGVTDKMYEVDVAEYRAAILSVLDGDNPVDPDREYYNLLITLATFTEKEEIAEEKLISLVIAYVGRTKAYKTVKEKLNLPDEADRLETLSLSINNVLDILNAIKSAKRGTRLISEVSESEEITVGVIRTFKGLQINGIKNLSEILQRMIGVMAKIVYKKKELAKMTEEKISSLKDTSGLKDKYVIAVTKEKWREFKKTLGGDSSVKKELSAIYDLNVFEIIEVDSMDEIDISLGKRVTYLVDPSERGKLDDIDSKKQEAINYLLMPYTRSSFYLAANIALAEGETDGMDTLAVTLIKELYALVMDKNVSDIKDSELKDLFSRPWMILDKIRGFSKDLDTLTIAARQIEKAA